MMRVVLINPPNLGEAEKHWRRLNLGLGYVAAALLADGRDVTVVDAKLEDLSPEETVLRAVAATPDLIGITAMTVEFPQVAAIAERFKAQWHAPIILGGAHCNAVGPRALQECEAIDFCCCGEGEQLTVELTHCLEGNIERTGIKGLVYRQGKAILTNPPRPYLANWDSLPFPAWQLFPRTSCIPLLTYRGCPYRCLFCSHNSGREARCRSVENVVLELEQVVRCYNPAIISIADETFGLDPGRTKGMLREIIRRGLQFRTRFCAQTRADCIDSEIVLLLKEANFDTLEVGVESGNDSVLKRINKGISRAQAEVAVAMVRQHGLRVLCKFILGHPHETKESLMDTVRLISHLNPDGVSVSIMTPYPGTPIYEMAKKRKGGYRLRSEDWRLFDKYSGGVLEFENFSLTYLKWVQIWCYIRLYLAHWRLRDLAELAFEHYTLVGRMALGLLQQMVADVFSRAQRRSSPRPS